ncbi:MAG TPA: dockerin type I domain-containing protein, partial [Bryobacteraceae bacterium]|nr:dockerin type I domain-containing protein [Bryobacteraceae bacterium]
TQFNGQLFVTAGTYEGSGIILASPNPSAGDNSFQQVGPDWSVMPTWDVEVFNNFLYATTGFTRQENPAEAGYGVYKTAGTGKAPYPFTPIVINGGYQSNPSLMAPNGLYMHIFRNELYVSTNRPTELIKVRADDSWDLVVGEPRPLPPDVNIGTSGASGQIMPLSGFGSGFGNWMNGHFWRMGSITGMGEPDQAASGQNLFLGTWDWSVGLQQFQTLSPLDNAFTHQYGTDVYRTEDGSHWSVITQAGFGDANNSGTRSLEATPVGLFLGTARQRFGAEVFLRTSGSTNPLLAPRRLMAESAVTAGTTVNLTWDPPPNAVSFNVYRATVKSIAQMALSIGSINVPLPNGSSLKVTMQEIESGQFNSLCANSAGTSLAQLCNLMEVFDGSAFLNSPASFPGPYALVGQTTEPTYTEQQPSTIPSLYYVRAVDANGNLSDPSNIMAAPSKSAPIEQLACDINGDGYVDSNDIDLINESIGTPVFGTTDPRDADGDGKISALDAHVCSEMCNQSGCQLQ